MARNRIVIVPDLHGDGKELCIMREMAEIGGYMGLELNEGRMLHEDALALNTARNCLAYLIEARGIRQIALPYYLCDSVARLCESCHVEIQFYCVDENLLPIDVKSLGSGYLYLVNYYGQLTKEQILGYKAACPRLIVDNIQAYFEEPVLGVDTIYTCRKFFGVPDGAFLYTDAKLGRELERDVSWDRMGHILGRFDTSASEHYEQYTTHEQLLQSVPLRRMSRLTENLLRGIDYERVRTRRTANFSYLAERMGKINRLNLRPIDGAYAYPLWLGHGADIRKRLIAEHIYVPTLWPNVISDTHADSLAQELAANLLPLPCDQRYGEKEMELLCENIDWAISES